MTTKAQGWRKRQIADKQEQHMTIKAMKQALEALERFAKGESSDIPVTKLTNALRQALSEAQLSVNENSHAIEQAEKQEPVKMVAYNCLCGRIMKFESVNGIVAPQREWVGLTPDEVFGIANKHPVEGFDPDIMAYTRAIEQTLKEKNT